MADNRYISGIKINNLLHLRDISIDITDDSSPHLILTGRNGSGKTILMNAIAGFLDRIKNDAQLNFLQLDSILEYNVGLLGTLAEGTPEYLRIEALCRSYRRQIDDLRGKVELSFGHGYGFLEDYRRGDFIIAFYEAARKIRISEPGSPTKPTLDAKGDIRKSLVGQLLSFLSDLKIQEALARNEGLAEEADVIRDWFGNFEKVLSGFFEDPALKLKFNYRQYTFSILTAGKSFKFTELSDGFAAILDVAADLMLKMQSGDTPSARFDKPGIVLIDEVETHLHLRLQKTILPMLTALFPNIQFIVTSHSPFVLGSLPSATAFDLERRTPIADLTEYSYQAIAEGYFGIRTESGYSLGRYDELRRLLETRDLDEYGRLAARRLIADFEKIPEALSPELVGAYRQLAIRYSEKIKELLGK